MSEAAKKPSSYRKHMRIGLIEGIPSQIIFMLLGGPYLTGYLLYLGASSLEVGIAAAIPSLSNVMQLFAALAMQYFTNRKLVMVLFGGFHRFMWVMTGLVPFIFPENLWVTAYLFMMLLAYISNGIAGVFWSSLIADYVPAKLTGRYFGLRNAVMNTAGSAVLFVSGLVLDGYGEDIGYGFIYIVCAIAMVADIILLSCHPNVEFEKSQESDIGKRFMKPFRDAAFFKTSLFIAIFLFFYGCVVPFYNYLMLDVLMISYSWVSIITIIHYIAMIIAYYCWGRLNARYSTRQLLMWSLPFIGLSSLAWGLIGWMPAVPLLILIHILLGIGLGGYNLLNFTFIIGDTPKSDRPVYIGVFTALTGLTTFAGSTVGGVLFDWLETMSRNLQLYGMTLTIGLVLVVMMAIWGRQVFGTDWTVPRRRNRAAGRIGRDR